MVKYSFWNLVLLLSLFSSPVAAVQPSVVTRIEIATIRDGQRVVIGEFDHVRADRRVAMRDSRNGYWDIWQIGEDGRVSLERVVPGLGAFVEFDSGELLARDINIKWTDLEQPWRPEILRGCRSDTKERGFSCELDNAGNIIAVSFPLGAVVEEWRAKVVDATGAPVESGAILSAPPTFHRWDAADFGDQENLPALREFQKAARLEALSGTHSEHAH